MHYRLWENVHIVYRIMLHLSHKLQKLRHMCLNIWQKNTKIIERTCSVPRHVNEVRLLNPQPPPPPPPHSPTEEFLRLGNLLGHRSPTCASTSTFSINAQLLFASISSRNVKEGILQVHYTDALQFVHCHSSMENRVVTI